MAMVDQGAAAATSAAIPSLGAVSSLAFDPGFLKVETIDDYLAFASSGKGPVDPRFSIFSKVPDLSPGKDPYPLVLCEFLAYKAALAYQDEDPIRKYLDLNCRRVGVSTYAFFDSKRTKGDTQGYGFVLGDTAFIVMRGTAGLADWIDDATAAMTDSFWVGKKTRTQFAALPPRHLGFARAWDNVLPQVETWVATLPKNIRFCFSGHSLGGALAIIGAHDFARKGRPIAAVVTFAAPQVGGHLFAEDYHEKLGLKSRTLRLESNEDAVPRLKLSGDFQPVGERWLIDKRPMISGMERFWAALLFIAGWSPGKPTENKPAENKGPAPSPKSEEDKRPKSGKAESSADKQAQPEATKPATKTDPRQALLVLVFIAATILVFLLTRKLLIRYQAHGAEKRYALYLTTLSYRRIRELRISDVKLASDAEYDRAFADLNTHLGYIRGLDGKAFATLKDRPVQVTKKLAEKFSLETKDDGGYSAYIW